MMNEPPKKSKAPYVVVGAGIVAAIWWFNAQGHASPPTSPSESSTVSCDTVLDRVVDRVRADDTAGSINSEIDWLASNCPAQYDTFTDYASGTATAGIGPSTCDSLAAHLSDAAVRLLYRDGFCTAGAAAEPASSQPGGGIAWNQAVDYAGTEQRVCGPLAGGGNSEDDVFLNLGRDYPDPQRFQIVVWDIGGLEPIGGGVTLCTSGLITLYNGVAQIELYDPSVIEIYN